MKGKRKLRTCKCCGGELQPTNIYLCEACQEAGMGRRMDDKLGLTAQELHRIAQHRQDVGQKILEGFDMAKTDLLARLYRPPYSTYGRFKGYVDSTGKLPPKEFLR